MPKLYLTFLIVTACSFLHATTIDVRLVIKPGLLTLSNGGTVEVITYNNTDSFSENSALLVWELGDVVNLKIVNNDTQNHGFNADGLTSFGIIPAGDSVIQTINLSNAGVFRYNDNVNPPFNSYLGLSGIIHIKDPSDTTPYFYWDIREIQSNWNPILYGSGIVNLTDYDPDFFTINGNHNPNINLDPIAKVIGNVGVEFKIVLVNNGLSIHSMHFHGYHLLSAADSKHPAFVGREKDTFPLYPHEHLILSCTPDKPGEYPVHDHNLVAVTGGQEYATGMFLTLLIAP
ncbi:MAG: multicopper oxidase domain-containing protein [Crocinitomicaceae bacterium]|nr:multicopper oxidase domain-containing protein [Crocinitomicaceae bacterium]MDG1777548.1 multicopper oxidase domain-containing protein [Crocinitomicaceae bacterium]